MRFITITVMFIILSGCATVGSKFRFRGPKEIRMGKTTQAEVLRRYGTPFRVGYDSGLTQWTYALYKYYLFSEAETKDLIVIFNKDRTVKRYVYNSSLEEDKLRIMSR